MRHRREAVALFFLGGSMVKMDDVRDIAQRMRDAVFTSGWKKDLEDMIPTPEKPDEEVCDAVSHARA